MIALASLAVGWAKTASAEPRSATPVFNWTGFYAGLNGGFGGGVARPAYDLSAAPAIGGYPGFTSTDNQIHRLGGSFAGGQVGYNYQFRNNVVLGVESDFQWSDVRASNRSDSAVVFDLTSQFPINALTATDMTIRQNWFGTTRLRAGYQFADRFLAYVTGGVAYSGFTASNWGVGTELSPFPIVFSHTSGAATSTRIGWTAGAGVEYALSNHLSVKSEYLYSEYSGFIAPYLNTALSTPAETSGTFSTGTLGIHLIRAGLNYRFGEAGEVPGASQWPAPARSLPLLDWTGFYVGMNGGYGGGIAKPALSELTQRQIPFLNETDSSNVNQTLRAAGFVFGGQFGYNRQLANKLVAGIETDLQWSDIHASNQSNISGAYNPPSPNSFSSNSRLTVGQNWFGTTRLRLGYQVFDRSLVYVTGGAAYAGFSADNSGMSNDPANGSSVTTTSGSRNSTKIGWTAGAGVEYAIAGNLSFKTEYLYSEYAGFTVPYQRTFTTGFSTATTEGSLSSGTIGIHLVRAGLNWKLGESGR